MNQPINALYLSPHLDDIALSCGGQVFARTQAGERVLVVTTMAGEPPAGPLSAFAQSLHTRWELAADVVAARRAEDVAACQILGAEWQHWEVPDCVYRTDGVGGWRYPDWTAVITTLHPTDKTLITHLAKRFRQLPAAATIIAPLGLGGHVDHRLVRRAAEQAFGDKVRYYEDYPYAREPGALDAVLPADRTGWQATTIPLTTADLAAKVAAIAAFESQVSSFFNGRGDISPQIHAYTTQVGGERLWHRTNALST